MKKMICLLTCIFIWLFLISPAFAKNNNEIIGFWFGTYTANQGETSLLISIFNENSQNTKAIFIFGPTYRNSSVPSGSFYMDVTYDKNTSEVELVGIEWIDRPNNYYMLDLSGVVSPQNDNMKMTGSAYASKNDPFPYGGGKQGDFLLIRPTVCYGLHNGELQVFIEPEGARNAGAQWRREGTTTWNSSGHIESNLPIGKYTVHFKVVPGWRPEETINVKVQPDTTTQATGYYFEQAMVLPGVMLLLLDE